MANFTDVLYQYKNIISYVSQKTGTEADLIKSEILDMMEQMEKSKNSGFSIGVNQSRFDGIIYQFVIMHLLGAKKIEGYNVADYSYQGKDIEFKIATSGILKIKVAVKPMNQNSPVFYEHYDKLHFIISLIPPFTVYVVDGKELEKYITNNYNQIQKHMSKNETVMGMWKVFLEIPVDKIRNIVENTINI
jgi:hypothetical protein